jgi:hypothetical protein
MRPKLKSRNNATVSPRAGLTLPDSGDLPTASEAYANQFRVSDGVPYFCDGTQWVCLLRDLTQSATIASGAVTLTGPWVGLLTLDTESAAASDDLDTISGGTSGQRIALRASDNARTVVAKDSTGNLRLSGDFNLNHSRDTLTLIFADPNWLQLANADNEA